MNNRVIHKSSLLLLDFINESREIVLKYPYLADHERQLRLLGHIYGTGAFLYEAQALLDHYNKKNIWEDVKQTANADVLRYETLVKKEIENTQAPIDFLNDGGDIGMVILPEETNWGFSNYLPILLEKNVDIMKQHTPEIREGLNRWFNRES